MGEEDEGKCVQAAGCCFDAFGNYLVICSKTSRVMVYRYDGQRLCDMTFPEGVIQRPSDVSINDDGKMAIVSLTGQTFLFDLVQEPGECQPAEECPTRGPIPRHGYRFPYRTRGGRGNNNNNRQQQQPDRRGNLKHGPNSVDISERLRGRIGARGRAALRSFYPQKKSPFMPTRKTPY